MEVSSGGELTTTYVSRPTEASNCLQYNSMAKHVHLSANPVFLKMKAITNPAV